MEMTRAKSSLRMPLAAFTRRKTRPIRKTRTTRSSVGVINMSRRRSSRTTPERRGHILIRFLKVKITTISLPVVAHACPYSIHTHCSS